MLPHVSGLRKNPPGWLLDQNLKIKKTLHNLLLINEKHVSETL